MDWLAFIFEIVHLLVYPMIWIWRKTNAPFELPDVLEYEDDGGFRLTDE